MKESKRNNKTGLSIIRNRFNRQQTTPQEIGNETNLSIPSPEKSRIRRAATVVLRGRGSRSSASYEVGSPLSSSPRARNSVFYMPESDKGVDVASMFVRPLPGEVESLRLNDLSLGEMMSLLHRQINDLNSMVLPMTTGKAEVNMTVSVLYIRECVIVSFSLSLSLPPSLSPPSLSLPPSLSSRLVK